MLIKRRLMTEAVVLEMLGQMGAIVADSHVVYTKGDHGTAYIDKDWAMHKTPADVLIAYQIAHRFKDREIEVVVGPETGGAILAKLVAIELVQLTGKSVNFAYARKRQGGGFEFQSQYPALITGHRVLVVEDILNTGGSALDTVNAVKALGGILVGLGALCNRGGVTASQVGDPPEFFSTVNVTLDRYPPDSCPLCEAGTPFNIKVGHGRKFLHDHPEMRHLAPAGYVPPQG